VAEGEGCVVTFKVPIRGGEVEICASWGTSINRDGVESLCNSRVSIDLPIHSLSPVEARAVAVAIVACSEEIAREEERLARVAQIRRG
jgi:hypothetical protein